MENAPQTWKVTPAQYAEMLKNVNSAGFHLIGNSGEATKDGVTVGWEYDGTTLSITVINRSWYDPSVSDIKARIAKAVNGALG
jgi:hypothetical protein